jgi:hypothetical protein
LDFFTNKDRSKVDRPSADAMINQPERIQN